MNQLYRRHGFTRKMFAVVGHNGLVARTTPHSEDSGLGSRTSEDDLQPSIAKARDIFPEHLYASASGQPLLQ